MVFCLRYREVFEKDSRGFEVDRESRARGSNRKSCEECFFRAKLSGALRVSFFSLQMDIILRVIVQLSIEKREKEREREFYFNFKMDLWTERRLVKWKCWEKSERCAICRRIMRFNLLDKLLMSDEVWRCVFLRCISISFALLSRIFNYFCNQYWK